MLPWMAMMASMGANQMPAPTINKKKKKHKRQSQAATQGSEGCLGQEAAPVEPEAPEEPAVIVASLDAEEEHISVEKAFRCSSHITLSFFAPIAAFRRRASKKYLVDSGLLTFDI